MKSTELDEIEARARAATLGPWEVWTGHTEVYAQVVENTPGAIRSKIGAVAKCEADDLYEDDDEPDNEDQAATNAQFVAHAREDIPRLTIEVRFLHDVLRGLGVTPDAITMDTTPAEVMAMARAEVVEGCVERIRRHVKEKPPNAHDDAICYSCARRVISLIQDPSAVSHGDSKEPSRIAMWIHSVVRVPGRGLVAVVDDVAELQLGATVSQDGYPWKIVGIEHPVIDGRRGVLLRSSPSDPDAKPQRGRCTLESAPPSVVSTEAREQALMREAFLLGWDSESGDAEHFLDAEGSRGPEQWAKVYACVESRVKGSR